MKREHDPYSQHTDGPKFKNFILASVAVHVLLVAFLFVFSHNAPVSSPTETVEITLLNPPEPPPEALQKKPLPQPTTVVESDSAAANNQLSEKAKYLSDRSNTVTKETRAKSGLKFHNSATPPSAKAARPQPAPGAAVQPRSAKSAAQIHGETARDRAEQKLFGGGFDAYRAVAQQQQPAVAGGRTTASEASSTNDLLEGAEDDLITRLNTREYKYAGYYHRIKNQLNQWWVPKVQEKFTKMMNQGRTIASAENKVTRLIIILNDQGNLVNVQVLAESGVRDLDDAAIEAFRSAAPFPNPPRGMVDSDGTVKIRWDCVVES